MTLGVLVTGATGFIGRALVARLAAEPRFRVRASVRRRSELLPSAVEQVVTGGLSGATDWSEVLRDMGAAVHLAARAHVLDDRAADPLAEFRRINVEGAANFATQAAATAGFRRFVFVSSIGVNGNATHGRPFSEVDPPRPVEPYAVSKREAEDALKAIADRTALELTIVRPPLVYGPGAPGNFGRLARIVARGVPLPFGAIRNRRSLIAIDNLVDFITIAIANPAAANETFLVSDGEDLSTAELVTRLGRAQGRRPRLIPVPAAILRSVAALVGKRDVVDRLIGSLEIDSTKARRVLQWTPPVAVDEALRRTALGA